MRASTFRAGLVALAVLVCTACSGTIRGMRAQSLNLPAGVPFSHLVETAEANGYQVALVQADRTRFGVLANYGRDQERDWNYRIAIACYGTRCTVTPYGPRVEWTHTEFQLPGHLRTEMLALHALLQSSVNAYPR